MHETPALQSVLRQQVQSPRSSANLNLINFPAAAHWKRPIVKLRSLLDPFTASLHQTQQCVALPGTCSTCCHHR